MFLFSSIELRRRGAFVFGRLSAALILTTTSIDLSLLVSLHLMCPHNAGIRLISFYLLIYPFARHLTRSARSKTDPNARRYEESDVSAFDDEDASDDEAPRK
jgi:hypothetical protein